VIYFFFLTPTVLWMSLSEHTLEA